MLRRYIFSHTLLQVKAAFEAVIKLHGSSIGNSTQPHPGKLWARQLKGEGAMVKKWRLILRNLPFNVSPSISNNMSLLSQRRIPGGNR